MGWSSAATGGAAVVLLLGVLGALAAVSAWIVEAPLRVGDLVGLLVADAASAALLAVFVRLRTARAAMQVAGLAAAAGIFAFFGMSALLGAGHDQMAVVLGFAPVSAGLIAAGGAGYLTRGMRKWRTQRISM